MFRDTTPNMHKGGHMHKPLEAALATLEDNIEEHYSTQQEASLEVIQSKPLEPEVSGDDLHEIREKIKAARLEKLMARQLANELNAHKPQDNATNSFEETFAENLALSKPQEESNLQSEELIQSIDETSKALNSYISELDDTHAESDEDNEAFGIIENQVKQIQLLEFLRNKEADQTQKLTLAITQLEKLAQTQQQALEDNRSEFNELFTKTQELNEQIANNERDNAELRKSLLIAEENTKAYKKERVEIAEEYETLQEKYTQIAKRNLEQQTQHQERAAELETSLKELIAEVKSLRREKSDMVQEIDANNKLVILQDEMITALSINESETLKI